MSESKKIKEIKRLVAGVFEERQKKNMNKNGSISVSWPVYDEKEILSAFDTLLKLRISQGPTVRLFENMYAKYAGVKYAVAVNSGSSANLLALNTFLEAGDFKKGDEVIVPAATFATVASPIIQLGLVPVYVDIDPETWNIDPVEVEKAISKKTRVIMPVHSFGNPADMKAILAIARKHHLKVLEDCCEAHGARIGDKMVGSFGDMSTLSFFVAHNMTTGEGGMILTTNKKYADILRSLREFGRLPHDILAKYRFNYPDTVMKNFDARYIATCLGYNVRMTDVTASLGVEQLKKLEKLNRCRIQIVSQYQTFLNQYNRYLEFQIVKKGTRHTYYGYPFMVRKDAPFTRLELAEYLEANGIETRAFFSGCIPDQPGFRGTVKRIVGSLPISRHARDATIFIGCHPALGEMHIAHVEKVFKKFFDARGL